MPYPPINIDIFQVFSEIPKLIDQLKIMKYDEKLNKVIEKLSTIETNIRTEINQFKGECQIIQTK